MTRRIATLLVLALSLLTGAAQAAESYVKGLLWQVQRAGQAPSYVFGTIHSEDPRVLAVPRTVAVALDRARVFVMEARLDAAAMAVMTGAMMLAEGQRLDQLLGEATYRRTVAAAAGFGIPEFVLQGMKPWAVGLTLSMPKPETGVFLDLALMQRAAARGMPVEGLETVEEQIEPLDRLTGEEQIRMLTDVLDQLPEADRFFAQLHAAYLARDLGRLMRLTEAQQAKGDRRVNEKLMAQLVDARNLRMVERMEPFLRDGNAFIAIGALHLPGRMGVLALLAQRGYRLRALY